MKLFLTYKDLLYRSRRWIFFAIIFALIWVLAGYFTAVTFPEIIPVFFESLGETLDQALEGAEPAPTFDFALALFEQNSLAAALAMFSGIIFGIMPVISLAVNFFALGFLAGPVFGNIPDMQTIGPGLFVAAIAPHGIFELPALLLAAAFGMRLGWDWLLPSASGMRKQIFARSFKDALLALPLIVLLLVIAALIEAFVTFNLVN